MSHFVNYEDAGEKTTKIEKMNTRVISRDGILLGIFILITCIKVLLIPTYHSTDFEVHRNWLAITHNLPVNEWYTTVKSQWTLDYPPFFAWYEGLLSWFASIVDPQMLKEESFNYASAETKLFQRTTVMISDIVFAYGVREAGNTFCKSDNSFILLVFFSLCNIGLLVVDHIHFQYNGFLLGFLLLAVTRVSNPSKENLVLGGALWFSILLNLKHIYLYVAPAFGVWLFRWFCFHNGFHISRFVKLAVIVTAVFALSFGPFISQLPQVLSRLFPFKRGLLHSYWAANFWAVYAAVDKVLIFVWKRAGWIDNIKTASMTGGLVQEESFTILPTPTPLVTFVFTFISMMPALWTLVFKSASNINSKDFVKSVVLCGLCSFMFSWHVHEKAILTAIIPLCILATTDTNDARVFLILSSAGFTGLFPLLYPDNLTPLKIFLSIFHLTASIIVSINQFGQRLLYLHEYLYIGSLPLVTIYETVVHKWLFGEKLPFLPLAFTSVYCAIGIIYAFIICYYTFVFSKSPIVITGKKKDDNRRVEVIEKKNVAKRTKRK